MRALLVSLLLVSSAQAFEATIHLDLMAIEEFGRSPLDVYGAGGQHQIPVIDYTQNPPLIIDPGNPDFHLVSPPTPREAGGYVSYAWSDLVVTTLPIDVITDGSYITLGTYHYRPVYARISGPAFDTYGWQWSLEQSYTVNGGPVQWAEVTHTPRSNWLQDPSEEDGILADTAPNFPGATDAADLAHAQALLDAGLFSQEQYDNVLRQTGALNPPEPVPGDGMALLDWQQGLGMRGGASIDSGDFTHEGVVNYADLGAWKAAENAAAVGSARGVPEPGAVDLAGIAVVFAIACFWSRGQKQ